MGISPGSVDVILGFRDEGFRNGVSGARNEVDRLKQEIDGMSGKLPLGFQRARPAVDQYAQSVKRATVDTKGLTLSMVGLGTTIIGISAASSRLDFAANRLEKTQVAVRRIEDQIASTRKNLNRLTEQGKTNTEDYAVQVGRLETAFADLKTKEEDVKLAQTALNDTQMLFATTIVNTGINSIFLMKSAFAGLSLQQIKTTITTKLFSRAVVSNTGAQQLNAVATLKAAAATRTFGHTLKMALLPLMAITVAFAVWEGAIAPYLKEQHDVNLSVLEWTDNMLGAKKGLEETSSELDEFKKLMGESGDTTDQQTKSLRELFGLTKDASSHPMVRFWEQVKFAQENTLTSLVKLNAEQGKFNELVGTSPSGNVSAPAGAGTQTSVRTGKSGSYSTAQQEKQTSAVITETLANTHDPKVDKAITSTVIEEFDKDPSMFEEVFGESVIEFMGRTQTRKALSGMFTEEVISKVTGSQFRVPAAGITEEDFISQLGTGSGFGSPSKLTGIGLLGLKGGIPSAPTNPLFVANPTKVQEIHGITKDELTARLAPVQQQWEQLVMAGDLTALRKWAIDASPLLGFDIEKAFMKLGFLPPVGTVDPLANFNAIATEGTSLGIASLASLEESFRNVSAGGSLSGAHAGLLNKQLREAAIREFEGFGTNTESALNFVSQFTRGGNRPLLTDYEMLKRRTNAMKFLFDSQSEERRNQQGGLGVFGSAGLPGFSFSGMNNSFQSSAIQQFYRNTAIGRSIIERQNRLRARINDDDFTGFSRADFGGQAQSSSGIVIAQSAIDAGYSASGQIGGARRFASRNRVALMARRQELAAEKAFRNSFAGIRQGILGTALRRGAGDFTSRGFTLGRTQANLMKRTGASFSADRNVVFDAARFGLFDGIDPQQILREPGGVRLILQESKNFIDNLDNVLGKVGTSVDELQADVAERLGNTNLSSLPRTQRIRFFRNRQQQIRLAEIAAVQRGLLAAHLGSYAELAESESRINFFDDYLSVAPKNSPYAFQKGKPAGLLPTLDQATLTALLQQANKKDRDAILRELNDMMAFKNKEQYATVLT